MVAQGKYAEICAEAQQAARVQAVVLIVPNGNDGSGFSVHAESGISELLPSILRRVADDIPGQVGIS
jgi:hypothetical protein